MNREYFSTFIRISIYILIGTFCVFFLRLYQLQIIKGEDYRTASKSNRVKITMIPSPRGIIYDRNGIALVKNIPFYYASVMPQTKDLNVKHLSRLLNIDEQEITEILEKEKNNFFKPIILKEGLSFEDVTQIEARRSDFPGLTIDTTVTRNYVYNKIGSHVIGYLGKPNKQQLSKAQYGKLTPEMFIGQWAAEAMYDDVLRGTPGKEIIEVDALGRQLKELQGIPPITGKDITLSIDINLQKAAEDAFDGKQGALVAINPRNGEILSLVSLPSFDPNDFVMGINSKKWKALNEDKSYPLINRALQSSYPPGSIFKVLVSAAGIEEGVITRGFSPFCGHIMNYGKWSFACWGRHGGISFPNALIESCDIFYYQAGKKLGINKIADYAKQFGLGEKTGLNIAGSSEKSGLIPTTKWKKEALGKSWYLGETFISAIGQGYVSLTPIQAALMISIVANEGLKIPLTIIKSDETSSKPIKKLDINNKTFISIKEALYGVVNTRRGTGTKARSAIVEISGKTGTAQVVKGRIKSEKLKKQHRDHAWFVAFAPFENPEIALSIIVEHGGHGGEAAAPIAKKVIEAYISNKK
ncbi:peptidoglycan glycosyltransferase [Candidatus Magnetoovum chiemensis]|nr:peptidoglycan glycosyltransferase [Candidatus Magnetoovum chiemensis]